MSLDRAAKLAAAAQARMDARAAAGIPEPTHPDRLVDPTDERGRALDAAMPHDWQAMTLERFDTYSANLREAALCLAQFIEQPRGLVYLYGDVGTGKSHLAAGTAVRLVERNYLVRVYRCADVATMLRRAAGVSAGELEMVKNRLKNVRVLVLDDFGAEHMTDFLAAEWLDLLDYRYGQAAATLITSNVAPDALDMPRLTSRLADRRMSTVFGIAARDYRTGTMPATEMRAADFAPPADVISLCATCGGSGFVRQRLPIGHPDFGKSFTCPTCKGELVAMKNGGAA